MKIDQINLTEEGWERLEHFMIANNIKLYNHAIELLLEKHGGE